jgi:hypothetical protein
MLEQISFAWMGVWGRCPHRRGGTPAPHVPYSDENRYISILEITWLIASLNQDFRKIDKVMMKIV